MIRVCFLFLFSSLLFTACSTKPVPGVPAVPVNLFTVKPQQVFYFDKFPANTVALSQVDLRPQVQGYITGISFIEGDHVRKGQALYEIDRQLYQEAYDQAKANVEVAQGNLKQAQQDADRYAYLNANDAVAKQVYDHAAISLQNAKNMLNAAEQTLKMAATNLTYSTISAPFDGTIGFSQVKMGNMVTVGQTVLNTISTDDPMGVDFLISEKQLLRFQDLKNGKGEKVDSLFTITLPNDSVYPYMGKISIIDRAVDPQTGTIRVRVVFPNPGYLLKPGTSCILRVHNMELTPKLVVPNKAVVELMGEYFLYVAKDTVARNADDSTKTHPVLMAIQKKVQLGQTIAPWVIVRKGVSTGERIVVDGVQSLHTGSVIDISKGGEGPKDKKKAESK
ncbi:MAG TPA: efflux RND transporter periplasmic adaptor subunit [Bacteroidia bacterium]|jgi:RND family efflux transporter MFP subunit|nr:efflux RND transporter periplasmic adaptor subunit [Bacteroidia bacterium]